MFIYRVSLHYKMNNNGLDNETFDIVLLRTRPNFQVALHAYTPSQYIDRHKEGGILGLVIPPTAPRTQPERVRKATWWSDLLSHIPLFTIRTLRLSYPIFLYATVPPFIR